MSARQRPSSSRSSAGSPRSKRNGTSARARCVASNWPLLLAPPSISTGNSVDRSTVAAISSASKLGFGHATDLHVANFLECVRTRQTPTAPMRVAFQAALVVQMANLSLKHGRRIRWNLQTSGVEM